jgi:hypothetical protein
MSDLADGNDSNSRAKPTAIARRHFENALREADTAGVTSEIMARHFLSLVVSKYLETRSVSDVRSELIAAGENCDPDTDYPFMRP